MYKVFPRCSKCGCEITENVTSEDYELGLLCTWCMKTVPAMEEQRREARRAYKEFLRGKNLRRWSCNPLAEKGYQKNLSEWR